MNGEISQINISRGGIPKREVRNARLELRGLDGDDWAHQAIHGGPDQALLLIGEEAIDQLRALGYPVYAGALGENLTTRGLDFGRLREGTQFRIGSTVEIELTRLREPCRTLAVYNQPGVVKIQRLLETEGRGGWYARVLKPGTLVAGDKITFLAQVV